MSEVMEMTEAMQKEINAFKMPQPARGQPVLYYRHANPTEQPEVAFVRTVYHRNIVIAVSGNACIGTVPHIADPRLRLNDDQRASGAWEFPEGDRKVSALEEKVARLEKEVATLNDLINDPVPKKPSK